MNWIPKSFSPLPLAAACALAAAIAWGQDVAGEGSGAGATDGHSDELSILLFGHSYGIDGTQYLPVLLHSAGIGSVRIGRFCRGNGSMEEYCAFFAADVPNPLFAYCECEPGTMRWTWKPMTARQAIEARPWDFVVFQNSVENEGRYETAQPYLDRMAAFVRTRSREMFGHEPTICWHLFWPISALAEDGADSMLARCLGFYGNSSRKMWDAYVRATEELVADTGITNVVPTGAAIMNLRSTALNTPEAMDFTRDKFHLSEGVGQYAAACVFFEYFVKPKYGVGVLGNPLRLPRCPAPVTDANAATLQQCAVDAIADPFAHSQSGAAGADGGPTSEP